MKKAMTIRDIAAIAGVSKSTVSRYINHGVVSEEARHKISLVIDEHNYEPNVYAQSLKAKKTKFIGIIAPGLDSIVTSKVIMSIDMALRRDGYNPLIINTSLRNDLAVESIENLMKLKVAGIILVATSKSDFQNTVISNLEIPLLIVGQLSESKPSIINNDYQAGYEIGSYIRKLGHTDVIYIGVQTDDVAVGVHRRDGIVAGLNSDDKKCRIKLIESDFTSDKSEEILLDILKYKVPSAVICATDRIALGARRAIQKHNLRIPEDISITGFGGYDLATLVSPPLTTVKFQNEQTGELAAQSIINLINHIDIPAVQVIDYTLILAQSTCSKNT